MTQQRQLKFGAILTGVGTTQNEWLHPQIPGNASVDIDGYRHQAQLAKAAKFDLVFIADSPYITSESAPHYLNRLESLTLLSAIAGATSNIGLVATLTTSYTEPFNVARQFASLDLISNGRAGWNVVTTRLEDAAGNSCVSAGCYAATTVMTPCAAIWACRYRPIATDLQRRSRLKPRLSRCQKPLRTNSLARGLARSAHAIARGFS